MKQEDKKKYEGLIQDESLLTPRELRKRKKEEKRAANPGLYNVIEWVVIIVLAMVIALFINFVIIINSTVPTGSMEPTIMTNSRMIGLRVSYWFNDPKRGDIVVFKYPDDPSQTFVKRVIGLPGETVEIIKGVTYVDGAELDEPYINPDYYIMKNMETENYGPYTVPEGCYFVLGDNRGNSRDARYWNNTYVRKKAILGKALFVYWPISRAGKLK